MRRQRVDITPGSAGATLLPELGPAPTDLVLRRWHGIGPMGGTDLDAVLRNLGRDDDRRRRRLGEHRDHQPRHGRREQGLPRRRAARRRRRHPHRLRDAIIDNMLSLLATITTTDDLLEVWKQQ